MLHNSILKFKKKIFLIVQFVYHLIFFYEPKKYKKINFYLIIFILVLIIKALGNFQRYSVAQQLEISTNYIKFGSFYPEGIFEKYYSHSVYFPGLAILINIFRIFIPDYFLHEFIYLFGVSIIFFFFYLMKFIIKEIFGNNLEYKNYWLIIIILCLWPSKFWLYYAVTLKTDTFAFALLFFLFFFLKPYSKTVDNLYYFKFFIAILALVFSLLLKQQAVIILFPFIFIFIYYKTIHSKIFSATSILIIFLTFYYLQLNKNLWFFNIEIYKHHGFFTLADVLKQNYNEIIRIMLFLIFIYTCHILRIYKVDLIEKNKRFLKNKKKNIWLIICFFLALTGFISGFKSGGNFGNFELSIIVFTIFFFFYLNDLDKRVLKIVVITLFALNIGSAQASIKSYIDHKKFQNLVIDNVKGTNLNILTDNVTQFASFLKSKDNHLYSFDTILTLFMHDNHKKKEQKLFYLHSQILENYDYIIIEKSNIKYLDIKSYSEIGSSKYYGVILKKNKI
jgi:hypothetical protein